jgi:DNA-directed RNA polymerase subunit beta'
VVARIPREGAKTKDITGGLPRVAELFEARVPRTTRSSPKSTAMSASARLQEQAPHLHRARRRHLEPVEYMVPKGKHIPVQEGDFVQKGDYIMDGNPAPHDILSIMGSRRWPNYLIDEVQDVYRLQGVKINDKHIEVIVRQMLQKWEILDSGETTLLKGEHVDKDRVRRGQRKGDGQGRRAGIRASRSCWASPRRRCRPGRSSRRPPSRRPRAC